MDSFYSDSPVVTRLLWMLAGAVVCGGSGFMLGLQGEQALPFAGVGAAVGAVVGLALGPAARGIFEWVLGGRYGH